MRAGSVPSKSYANLSASVVESRLIDSYGLELISRGDWTAGVLILSQVNEQVKIA